MSAGNSDYTVGSHIPPGSGDSLVVANYDCSPGFVSNAVSVTIAADGGVPSDFDHDGDVDVSDFVHFQACFNGPDQPPACG